MQTQATSVGDSANQPSTRAPKTALKTNTGSDSMDNQNRLEAITDRWNELDDLWDQLDITGLLEQHTPPHRRYLVDRLGRIRIEIESQMRHGCIS
jgi:hypothetical protein